MSADQLHKKSPKLINMKKLLILLTAFSFFVASCNNNKNGKNQNTNNRDKDDYGKNGNITTGDENKTNNNFGNSGWTELEKTKLLKDCIASFEENQSALANQICPCLLGKMEKKYTSFNDADTRSSEAELKSFTLQCNDEVVGNTDNNNTVHNWSSSDEYQWMNVCATPVLVEKMGEQRATSYCSCMMDKLKILYSSFQELNSKGTREDGIELGKQCIKELGIGQ